MYTEYSIGRYAVCGCGKAWLNFKGLWMSFGSFAKHEWARLHYRCACGSRLDFGDVLSQEVVVCAAAGCGKKYVVSREDDSFAPIGCKPFSVSEPSENEKRALYERFFPAREAKTLA